jgi:Tn3 transposase DDE domain
MVNVIVLWQTVYIQAALDHLAAKGYRIDPAEVARLTPLGHPAINLHGRYRTTNPPPRNRTSATTNQLIQDPARILGTGPVPREPAQRHRASLRSLTTPLTSPLLLSG